MSPTTMGILVRCAAVLLVLGWLIHPGVGHPEKCSLWRMLTAEDMLVSYAWLGEFSVVISLMELAPEIS